MSESPNIRVKGTELDHGSLGRAAPAMMRAANPAARFANRFSQVADKLYMSPDHCILYLARRVGEAQQAGDRSGSIFGRIYNRMTGEAVGFVNLSGAVLATTMTYVGDPVPEVFDKGKDYVIRLEIAENLLNRMKTKAKAEGLIK